MITAAEQFLNDIEGFLKRSKMTASAFGRSAVNDPNFVGDLRTGRQPNLGLVDKVHQYIRENEPAAEQVAS